ncbi:MAG: septum formation initiator family protein [Thermodesulfobacteriota bacterium]
MRRYKKHLYGFLIFFVVMFLLTVFGDKGLLTFNTMRGDRDTIALEIRELEVTQEALREEIERLKTDRKYIASIAREELGMIGKNEVIYRFNE